MTTRRSLLLAAVGTRLAAQQSGPPPGWTPPPWNPPFHLPDDVSLDADLVFARYGSRELKLDLFRPKAGSGPFPAVVYLSSTSTLQFQGREHFQRQAAYMASNGVIGACIENRIGEEGRWPAAIHDAKAAVRWLRANAPKYGVAEASIGAAGGSQGAWLASLLGTTDRVRDFEGDGGHSRFSSGVQSVVVLSPVLDLPAFAAARNERAVRTLTEAMGASYSQDPELWEFASPVTHVSEQSAPHLFIVSAADPVTPAQPAIDMAGRLDAAGVRAEVIKVEGGEHGFFNDPPSYQPVLEHMERWFRETLLNSVA